MVDNNEKDEKIIAIPFEDPTYNTYRSIDALPYHIFAEMKHFFKVYKELEQKETAVHQVNGPREAIEIVRQSIERYNDEFKFNP